MKHCKVDILLVTGMLSPYATVVEKLFRDLDKDKVTMLKIERAGDVLADTVSLSDRRGRRLNGTEMLNGFFLSLPTLPPACKGGPVDSSVLQGAGPIDLCRDARRGSQQGVLHKLRGIWGSGQRSQPQFAPAGQSTNVAWHVDGGLRPAQHPAAECHSQRPVAAD